MQQSDDTELLRRVAQRDPDASAELFERYADEIWRKMARGTSAAEADDLCQEVFVRALRRASTFRNDSSVRTWLWSIARNTLRERYRMRIAVDSPGEIAATGPGPESLVISAERSRQMVAALVHLPVKRSLQACRINWNTIPAVWR